MRHTLFQQGKPLLLDLQSSEEGGTIFYSPNKVQRARDLQSQKEDEARLARLQKQEEKDRRNREKAEKARMLEERKRTQAHNRELKLRAEAKRRHQKEIDLADRLASLQLQTDLKDTQKRQKKANRTDLQEEKDDVNDVVVVEAGCRKWQDHR